MCHNLYSATFMQTTIMGSPASGLVQTNSLINFVLLSVPTIIHTAGRKSILEHDFL